ncbi:hypothetical protein VAWG005_36520 [Aeromonas dhakensis]|nr:hypothetical protein VAWG003_36500 [Aeromonas dhakensis]BEE27724.1 hypothetical protein VAWG005_36520 [Aeromonas dhakensis]
MATQKVGAKLSHQFALDPVAHRQTWPDRIGEGGQGRQIALDGGIVFGSGMQSAHHLTPTFNRLFGKIIAATNSQSHFQSAQIQRGRIKIDIAELGLGAGYNFQ